MLPEAGGELVEGGDELIGAGEDFGALGVAAEADHDVGVALDFEVAGAVTDHDDGGGLEFGAEATGGADAAASGADAGSAGACCADACCAMPSESTISQKNRRRMVECGGMEGA